MSGSNFAAPMAATTDGGFPIFCLWNARSDRPRSGKACAGLPWVFLYVPRTFFTPEPSSSRCSLPPFSRCPKGPHPRPPHHTWPRRTLFDPDNPSPHTPASPSRGHASYRPFCPETFHADSPGISGILGRLAAFRFPQLAERGNIRRVSPGRCARCRLYNSLHPQ